MDEATIGELMSFVETDWECAEDDAAEPTFEVGDSSAGPSRLSEKPKIGVHQAMRNLALSKATREQEEVAAAATEGSN